MAKQSPPNGKSTAPTTAAAHAPTLLHNISEMPFADVRIVSAQFFADSFGIHLTDGRMIAIPYWWFPRIAEASAKQRGAYTLRLGGRSIWWEEIDEGLHIDGICAGKADNTTFARQWREARGYAWFDAWLYARLSEEQKTMLGERNKQWEAETKKASNHAASNDTAPSAPIMTLPPHQHLRPTEVLYELSKHEIKLSKQRLYQLTHGEKQIRNGKEYYISPQLQQEMDFVMVNGKVRYTASGVQHLLEAYNKKRRTVSL